MPERFRGTIKWILSFQHVSGNAIKMQDASRKREKKTKTNEDHLPTPSSSQSDLFFIKCLKFGRLQSLPDQLSTKKQRQRTCLQIPSTNFNFGVLTDKSWHPF